MGKVIQRLLRIPCLAEDRFFEMVSEYELQPLPDYRVVVC